MPRVSVEGLGRGRELAVALDSSVGKWVTGHRIRGMGPRLTRSVGDVLVAGD